MVSVKVNIDFNTSESRMLDMAADLGHVPFSDDQLKTIILSAAFGTIRRFTMGIMEEHHTATNPVTAMDEERRVEQRLDKLMREVERMHARREELRTMRLPTVRVVPPTPKR